MEEYTLRQLCELTGVPRRAVQSYETHGLVRPTGKTSRGYLLYDAEAKRQVESIRRLQSYGLSLKEIVAFQSLAPEERTAVLRGRLDELTARRDALDRYILELTEMINSADGE